MSCSSALMRSRPAAAVAITSIFRSKCASMSAISISACACGSSSISRMLTWRRSCVGRAGRGTVELSGFSTLANTSSRSITTPNGGTVCTSDSTGSPPPRLDDCRALAEGKAAYRARGVLADAFEREERLAIGRQLAPVARDRLAGDRLQTPRADVVAEGAPGFGDLVFVGGGQRAERRVFAKP